MSSAAPATTSLIGRDHAISALDAEVARTRDSHGGLVLVAGEAGIGKTTLVTEVLRRSDLSEVLVATGTAWDGEGAPGYWPWTQVLRDLRDGLDHTVWKEAQQSAGEAVQVLLGISSPPADVGSAVAFRLHDAVATLLVTASRCQPVIVLLDDLHWADVASVDLLEFLTRHAWFERVLVVATLRDVEVAAPDHPLAERLRRLTSKATTINLDGLDEDAVANLYGRIAGEPVADELLSDLHRRTGGNPFFVQELAHLRRGGTAPETVPPGVAAVVRARLEQLPAVVYELLQTAAVLGREFDRDILAAATDHSVEEVEGPLRVAADTGLLRAPTSERDAFHHDLVRATLLDELSTAQRRRRHAAIVAALEAAPETAASTHAVELAEHAYQAVGEVSRDRALRLLIAASGEECARLAAHEVVVHLGRALQLVDDDQPELRADLALQLGEAWHVAGDLGTARDIFEAEIVHARQRESPDHLARAILGLHGLGVPDPEQEWVREVDLIDEALAALQPVVEAADASGEDEDQDADLDSLHIQALAVSGRVRAHRAHGDREAEERTARAVELARAAGDDEALLVALLARHDVIWRPGTAAERVELAGEMERVGARCGDTSMELQGLLLRMVALLEQGEAAGLAAHDQLARRAERAGLPRFRYLAQSRAGALAILRGDFDAAADAIDESYALGERLEEVDRHRLWLEQRWALALRRGDHGQAQRLQDRHHDLDDAFYPDVTLAISSAASGSRVDREHFLRADARLADLVDELPGMFQASLFHARARIAVAAGDPQRCAQLRERLAPLRGGWAVVAGGGVIYGPYSLLLGELAAVEERFDEAIADLDAAIADAERLEARPWAVEARVAAANVRRRRDAAGDADAAATLLAQARREASELGLDHLVPGATDTDATTGGDADSEAESEQTAAEQDAADSRFQLDGQVWTLTYAGRTASVPATKGLKDLHALVSLPGVDVPAVELLDPAGGEVVRRSRQLGGDPVLDDQAREAYKQRLTELDEGIERATARHDDERAARLDQEREALLDELRRATGIGGRPRRLGDEAERARKTVTARIRDTIRRLDEQHPELSEHLRASVSTGATCRYQPAREVDWQL